MKKIRVLSLCFALLCGNYIAKNHEISSIGSFMVFHFEIENKKTVFVNNTKFDLQLHVKIVDPKSDGFGAHAYILPRGQKIEVDFSKLMKDVLQSGELKSGELKSDVLQSGELKSGELNCYLGLSRIKKMPLGVLQPLQTKKIKPESMAFTIRKSKFVSYSTFSFSVNKNGLLVCKAN